MNANQPSLKDDSAVRALHPAPGAIPAIIALTTDPGLTHALEELSASTAGLTFVGSAAELSERLLHGASGIALLDSASVPTSISEFVDGIARQFPEVVLVVAGGLAEQSQLAAQIGTGRVYRFVHKPASAQRLKLFMDAAARHQVSLIRQAAMPPPVAPHAHPEPGIGSDGPAGTPPSRNLLVGGGVAAVVVVAAVLFFALRGGKQEKAAAVPAAVTAEQQARAAQEAARARLEGELEQLLGNAENALIEVRLDDAERLAVAAQSIAQRLATPGAPENSRVRFLQGQIAKERERMGDEEQRRAAAGARQARLASLLKLAGERMQKGALVEPARDSALFYVESALDLSPGDAGTLATRASLVRLLLAAADRSIVGKDADTARRITDGAVALNASQSEIEKLRRRTDELRISLASGSAEPASASVRQAGAAAPAATQEAPAPIPAPAASAAAGSAAAPAEAGASTVSANALTRLRYVEPQYPDSARMSRQSGWVEVEFTVAVDGTVKDLVVLGAEPRNVFETNALAAVRRWRYAPVSRNGAPVEQRARLRLRFSGS